MMTKTDINIPAHTTSQSTYIEEGRGVDDPSSLEPVPSRPPKLQRSSSHAQTSLRRMATHEAGGNEDDHLHEHEEEENERRSSGGHVETNEETRSDTHEENVIGVKDEQTSGKKEIVLQDQTNLLPVRQIIFVFVGLTCAIFCSLLDQTM